MCSQALTQRLVGRAIRESEQGLQLVPFKQSLNFSRTASVSLALYICACHPPQRRNVLLPLQIDDLDQVGRHVCDQYPAGTPMFVGGQSMGALTSLHLMLRDETPWRGIVLGTATIDVEWNWVLRSSSSLEYRSFIMLSLLLGQLSTSMDVQSSEKALKKRLRKAYFHVFQTSVTLTHCSCLV